MSDSAVLTTLMSSMSIVTAMQATAIVALALAGAAPGLSTPAFTSGNMIDRAAARPCDRSPTGFGRLAFALAQLDPADLARLGLREPVDELDLPRIRVGAELGADVCLDLARELVGGLVALGEDDE